MIAHQEQISLNQQQKQLLQQQQQKQRTSLLSNLILAQPKNTTSTITIAQNSTKRTRIDPDTRAALIQRVPKAVKRTALIANPPAPPQLPKLQKAVKHTGPRPQPAASNVIIINDIAPSPNLLNKSPNTVPQSSAASTIKVQKAVKHTSAANMLLKELLPPPIMQSTKRPTVNKAVKHTGGGTNAYYQAGKLASPQLNKITLVNSSAAAHQPLSQLSLNSNNGDLKNAAQPNNKITITTTYVYKRVMSQPEIDLDLECEEEEIVYVVKEPEPEPEPIEVESSEPILQVEEVQVEQKETKIEEVELSKQTEVEQEQKEAETSEKIDSVDKQADKTVEKSEKALEKQQTSKSKIEDGSSETSEKKVASKKEKLSKKEEATTEAAQSSAGSYSNILAKFYARRPGALSAALKTSSSSSSNTNKKFKSASSTLPPDLRNGNYPAKVMFYS